MSQAKVIFWQMAKTPYGDILDRIDEAQNGGVDMRFYPACKTALLLFDLVGDWLHQNRNDPPSWLLDRHIEVIKQLGYEVEVQPYPDVSLGFDAEMRAAFAQTSMELNDFVELYKVDRAVEDFHRELTELGYEHAADEVVEYIRGWSEELGLPKGVQS